MPTYNFRNLRPGLRPEAALIVLREHEGHLAREQAREHERSRRIAKMELDAQRHEMLSNQLSEDIEQAEASGKSAGEIAADVEALRANFKETCRRSFG